MNVKRIIGACLAALGIGGLIFAVILFVIAVGWENPARTSITCALLSLIFFVSGVSMVQATKDQA